MLVVGQENVFGTLQPLDSFNPEVCYGQSRNDMVLKLLDHKVSFVQLGLDEASLFDRSMLLPLAWHNPGRLVQFERFYPVVSINANNQVHLLRQQVSVQDFV